MNFYYAALVAAMAIYFNCAVVSSVVVKGNKRLYRRKRSYGPAVRDRAFSADSSHRHCIQYGSSRRQKRLLERCLEKNTRKEELRQLKVAWRVKKARFEEREARRRERESKSAKATATVPEGTELSNTSSEGTPKISIPSITFLKKTSSITGKPSSQGESTFNRFEHSAHIEEKPQVTLAAAKRKTEREKNLGNSYFESLDDCVSICDACHKCGNGLQHYRGLCIPYRTKKDKALNKKEMKREYMQCKFEEFRDYTKFRLSFGQSDESSDSTSSHLSSLLPDDGAPGIEEKKRPVNHTNDEITSSYGKCRSSKEARLVRLINEYRAQKKQYLIPASKTMTKVRFCISHYCRQVYIC